MNLVCDRCGKSYSSYQCGKNYHFCSIECRRLAGKLVASSFDEDTRKRASQRITEVNRTMNNTPEYVARRRLSQRKRNNHSYPKFYGQHEHRVVAEKMLGRKLKPGEVVHHKDGNKQNNEPSNLEVMTQSEHIKLHLRQGGGKLCSHYTNIKK